MACSQPERSIHCYTRLAEAIKELGFAVYLTENDAPDAFLQRVAANTGVGMVPVNAPILMCGGVLANARLFISGRISPVHIRFIGRDAVPLSRIARAQGGQPAKSVGI